MAKVQQEGIRLNARKPKYSLYPEPETNENGDIAVIKMTIDFVAKDITGKERVMKRKSFPLWGQTKATLLEAMGKAKVDLESSQATDIDDAQNQIDDITALV